MKNLILTLIVTILAVQASVAQTPKEADPKDVGSLDAILKAVYDSISGDAGKARDWDRFRSLFHKDARLIPTGKNPTTKIAASSASTPDEYIKRAQPAFAKDGFHERELARQVDTFGNIAQVFSTYHAFRKSTDKEPFLRGINSFQLLNDGKRWWVVTIFWQAESVDNPIPRQYLTSKNR